MDPLDIPSFPVTGDKLADRDAGYHPLHDEDGCAYGSFEVFWMDSGVDPESPLSSEPGWYWASGWPGCIPDGDCVGPFDTSTDARVDADAGGNWGVRPTPMPVTS